MDVLPNIDVSDVMEIPKVFRCDEQTLPCDHTTKYRTLTGKLPMIFREFFYHFQILREIEVSEINFL